MKSIFKIGDKKKFSRIVSAADTAIFDAGQVHPVYSTFALARDAEWTCRFFVLEMKDDDEEGIGTGIEVKHLSPTLVGETVNFEAEIESLNGHEIICNFKAVAEKRVIAAGKVSQKILKKKKIKDIFEAL